MANLTPRLDRIEPNYVLNGAMDFWQRVVGGTTSLTTSNAAYTADRMRTSNQGATAKTIAVSRSTDLPSISVSGFTPIYSHLTEVTVAAASLSDAGDLVAPVMYRMEGSDYANLHGKFITVGFWFKASVAGTYSLAFNGAAFTRTYVTTFSVLASTWTYISKTIELESVGAYLFNNGLGLEVTIGAVSGSNFSTGTLNQWQSGNKYSASTSINWVGTLNATVRVAMFSIIAASKSLENQFSRTGRTIADEFAMCKRYYEKSYDVETIPGTAATSLGQHLVPARSDGVYQGTSSLKISKRAIPTVVLYSPVTGASGVIRSSNAGDLATSPSDIGQNSFTVSRTGGAATSDGTWQWIADSEL